MLLRTWFMSLKPRGGSFAGAVKASGDLDPTCIVSRENVIISLTPSVGELHPPERLHVAARPLGGAPRRPRSALRARESRRHEPRRRFRAEELQRYEKDLLILFRSSTKETKMASHLLLNRRQSIGHL